VNVRQLREALAQLDTEHDNAPVEVWLPGSWIALESKLIRIDRCVLIEGSMKPGSALYDRQRLETMILDDEVRREREERQRDEA
jgi:hypothetical protein